MHQMLEATESLAAGLQAGSLAHCGQVVAAAEDCSAPTGSTGIDRWVWTPGMCRRRRRRPNHGVRMWCETTRACN